MFGFGRRACFAKVPTKTKSKISVNTLNVYLCRAPVGFGVLLVELPDRARKTRLAL